MIALDPSSVGLMRRGRFIIRSTSSVFGGEKSVIFTSLSCVIEEELFLQAEYLNSMASMTGVGVENTKGALISVCVDWVRVVTRC